MGFKRETWRGLAWVGGWEVCHCGWCWSCKRRRECYSEELEGEGRAEEVKDKAHVELRKLFLRC